MAPHISPDCKSYLAISDALVKSQQVGRTGGTGALVGL